MANRHQDRGAGKGRARHGRAVDALALVAAGSPAAQCRATSATGFVLREDGTR